MKKNLLTFLPGIMAMILFCISGLLQAQIPTSGLVAYYPFNGNANDESGNGNNGTVNGATLTTDRFGNENSAYSFDGSNDYIDCGNPSIINTTLDGDYSISVWFNTSSLLEQRILEKRETYRGFLVTIYNGSNVGYLYGGDSYINTSLKPAFSQDTWNNYICIVNKVQQKIYSYLNGVLMDSVYSISTVSGSISNTHNIRFGINEDLVKPFNGYIDDIRIYNRALSQQEVTLLYQENICSDTTINDTAVYHVNDLSFQAVSPRSEFIQTDSLKTNTGNCDSVIIHYAKYIFDANYCTDTVEVFDTTFLTVYDTIAIYDSITVTDTLVINLITGISNDEFHTIKVYPNPSNNYLYIETDNLTNLANYQVKIINSIGHTQYVDYITTSTLSLDLSGWNTGIYYIQILNEKSEITDIKKLVLR